MATSSDNLARMEEARRANAVFGLTSGYVSDKISKTVHTMVSGYRSGQADYPFLLGKTAEIAALMGLLSDLESIQRRGVEASSKEVRGAP